MCEQVCTKEGSWWRKCETLHQSMHLPTKRNAHARSGHVTGGARAHLCVCEEGRWGGGIRAVGFYQTASDNAQRPPLRIRPPVISGHAQWALVTSEVHVTLCAFVLQLQ